MGIEMENRRRESDLGQRVSVLKALADRSRILVVNALFEKPHCAEELAERLKLAPSTISFHLRRLEEAGLVTESKAQYYVVYELRSDLLRMSLRDFVTVPPEEGSPENERMRRYREKVVRAFFLDGALVRIPKQWKKRMIVLEEFLAGFAPGETYEEREVNERIAPLFSDYCTIRRMLVDEGYMAREGEKYRRIAKEAGRMDNRSEIKKQYKEAPRVAGIFHVKNASDGKVLLGSSKNLHGPLNKHRFLLSIGRHWIKTMQEDWDRLGPDAFEFEVLEVVKMKDDPGFDLDGELAALERKWIERVQPFGEGGYNKDYKKGTGIRE